LAESWWVPFVNRFGWRERMLSDWNNNPAEGPTIRPLKAVSLRRVDITTPSTLTTAPVSPVNWTDPTHGLSTNHVGQVGQWVSLPHLSH